MPHVGSEIDANFYQLIHKILETPREAPTAERRFEKRSAFATSQRIASWDGDKFPEDREFVPVQCRDLTRSGFSYLSDAEPRFDALVVEFGAAPNALYIAAKILHYAPVICSPSGAVVRVSGRSRLAREATPQGERGKAMFLVGCRFTRRLRKPT